MPDSLILHDSNGDITDKYVLHSKCYLWDFSNFCNFLFLFSFRPSELYPKYILYYTKKVTADVLHDVKMLRK